MNGDQIGLNKVCISCNDIHIDRYRRTLCILNSMPSRFGMNYCAIVSVTHSNKANNVPQILSGKIAEMSAVNETSGYVTLVMHYLNSCKSFLAKYIMAAKKKEWTKQELSLFF